MVSVQSETAWTLRAIMREQGGTQGQKRFLARVTSACLIQHPLYLNRVGLEAAEASFMADFGKDNTVALKQLDKAHKACTAPQGVLGFVCVACLTARLTGGIRKAHQLE
jgi:hypothetical protein